MRIVDVLSRLRSEGVRGVAYDLQARLEVAADRGRLAAVSTRDESGSSISDDSEYPRFCELASQDDRVFARFRRSEIYMQILEHVTRREGASYLSELRSDPATLSALRSLVGGSEVGGPRTYRYREIGIASPTTLRYMKVAADLRRLHGDLKGMRIAEIGIGYGGQARAITTAWAVQRYELYDLPPILGLTRRYLQASGVATTRFGFHDGRRPEATRADLVVSNYAFSELRRDVQDAYLENVVLPAPRGYITYNHISPPELRSYSALEIMAMIPGAYTVPEVPLTHPRNEIIVWGNLDGH